MSKTKTLTAAQRALLLLENGYFRPNPAGSLVYVICPNGCGQIQEHVPSTATPRQIRKALLAAVTEHLRLDAALQAQGDRS